MANIDLQTGTFPITQIPLDAKAFAITAAELATLGTNDLKAFYYYEGLIIWCVENQLRYQWREEATPGETGGLLSTSFTYPANAVANGVTYTGRIFNLFLYQITVAEISDFQENVSLNIDVTRNSSYVNIRLDEDVMLDGDAVLVDESTLEFWVRADSYIINGTPYVATAEQKFLQALPGAGLKRIDVFFADIFGAVGVLTGPEAAIAVAPVLDPDTQIEITFVTLDEFGFTDITEELVYDENVGTPNEYAVTESTAGARFNLASTNDPQSNAVSIEGTNINDADRLTFTPENIVTTIGISSLYMRIKLKEAGKAIFRIRFWNGTTLVSGRRLRLIELDGFDIDNTTDHQIINVTVDRLRFRGDEFTHFTIDCHALGALTTYNGFFLDRVRLISGADGTGGFGDGTWIGLRDVFEQDYVGKAKYSPIVQNNERGQVLRREILFEDIVGPNAGIRTGVEHITGRTYRVFGSLYRIDNVTYDVFVEGEVTLDEPHDTFDRYDLFIIINGTGAKGSLTFISGTSPVSSVIVDGVTITSGSVAFDTDMATTALRTAENINSFVSFPNYWASANAGVLDVTAYDPGNGSDGFIIGVVTGNATSSVPLANGSNLHSVGFVKGDAIADPAEPNIDFASQVKVGFKRLTANETLEPPEITTYQVYNENLGVAGQEWDSNSIVVGGNLDYLINPYDLTKSALVPALSTGIYEWQNDVHIPYDANGSLTFAIKIDAPWAGGAQGGPNPTATIMKIGIFNTPLTLSSTLNVTAALLGLFGFDNNSTEWQYIQLSMDLWNFNIGGSGTDEFDTVKFTWARQPQLQLDDIAFQVGVTDGGGTIAPEYRLTEVIANKFSLTRDGIPVPEEITLISSTGLETVTENSETGWRIIGRDPLNYGDLGDNSFDFALNFSASSTFGARATNSWNVGGDNKIHPNAYGATAIGFSVDIGLDGNVGWDGIFGFGIGFGISINDYANYAFGVNLRLAGDPISGSGYSAIFGKEHSLDMVGGFGAGLALLGKGVGVTLLGQANVDFSSNLNIPNEAGKLQMVVGNGTLDAGALTAIVRSDSFRLYYSGVIELPSASNSLIDTLGAKAVLTLEYGDANYLRANLQTEFSTNIVAIAGHANNLLWFESAIARNYTVNNPFTNGDVIEFTNVGTANLTFVQGSGTLNAPQGFVLEPNRICSLVKRTSDGEYYLFGELT